MRKNIKPGPEVSLSKIDFDNFSHGTVKDPPASEIQSALADSLNLTIFDRYFEGRTGCVPYGSPVNSIAARTGYVAHKEGNIIVSDSGGIFTESDVGQYFNWDNYSELITAYIDASHVTGSDAVYRSGYSCGIVGLPSATLFHPALRHWFHVASGAVIFSDIDMSSWNNVLCISKDIPGTTRCDYAIIKNKLYLFTVNGIFKVSSDVDLPIMFKINILPPDTRLVGNARSGSTTSSYRYLYSATRINRNGIIVDRQSNGGDVEIDIETGTNLPDDDSIDFAEVFCDDDIDSTHPYLLSELYAPKISGGGENESHLTHYTIWRTRDLDAKNVYDINREEYNSPNRFIWNKDLRMCAAFYGTISGNVATLTIGEFEKGDEGNTLIFDNGWTTTITTVTTTKTAYISGSTELGPIAFALGSDRAIRGSVTDGVLTRTYGSRFTASDVRKNIFSANGTISVITEYVNENTVIVDSNTTLDTQGFVLDPTSRKYKDVITDEMLYAREDFYSCRNRYRMPLPDCNIGSVIPGFVVCAIRGESKIYYSHFENAFLQFMGQYIPNMQTSEDIQGDIQVMRVFDGTISVICSTKTWGATIGLSEFATLPSSTESIALMPGFKLVDDHRGCIDIDSIQPVEDGLVMMITNEQGGEALRTFDGISYSKDNYLIDPAQGGRIIKAMQDTIKKSIAVYDGNLGYVLWRKNA